MNNHFDTYLQKVHSHSTDSEVVMKVAAHMIGAVPSGMKRIIKGESHEVYEAQMFESNKSYIIRIAPESSAHFASENWAMQRVSQVGVPVPSPVAIHVARVATTQLAFSLYPKIHGYTEDVWGPQFDNSLYKDLAVEAGAYLRKIHSVSTSGYGPINEHGVGRFNTYLDRIMSVLQDLGAYESHLAKLCIQFYVDRAHKLSNVPAHLIHGDYGPKHFVIEDGVIRGIIDWEGVESGPYYMDFGRWSYYYQDKLPLDWLLEGYGITEGQRSEVNDLLPLIELFWGCHSLLYYCRHMRHEQAMEDKRKITKILRSA